MRGVTPFGHPGINARLSTPPGLSQIPTSFIGSYYQGIHHAPFTTYKHHQPPQPNTTKESQGATGGATRKPQNKQHQHHTQHQTSIMRW